MRIDESTRGRRLVLRAEPGETLPGALARALATERVTCGWLRAQGVLAEVELRGFASRVAGLVDARRVPGPVRIVTLEGSVAKQGKDVSVGLHALLTRETDRGAEWHAGEILGARVVVLEAIVEAFDDVEVRRELDSATGVWALGADLAGEPTEKLGGRTGLEARDARDAAVPPPAPKLEPHRAEPPRVEAPSTPKAAPSAHEDAPSRADAWASVAEASRREELRAARDDEDDDPAPAAGDSVLHFAFGRCDVIRADGDRLRLRVHKDGRVRDVATEMLSVKLLDQQGKKRSFRLDRKG